VPFAVRLGGHGRWVALCLLLLAGIDLVRERETAFPRSGALYVFAAALIAFCGVAVASGAWSVAPLLSVERAASFCLMVAAAGAVVLGTAGDREATRRTLVGVVVGAAIVAALGVLVYLVRHDLAVQQAAGSAAWRFRGFGMNPNTTPMLFAMAMPLAVWLAAASPRRRARSVYAAIAAGLYVELLLCGSRGGLVAAAVGVLVLVALCVPRVWLKGVLALVAVAAIVPGLTSRIGPTATVTPPPAGTTVPAPGENPAAPGPGVTTRPAICGHKVCSSASRAFLRRFPHFIGPLPSRAEDEVGQAIFGEKSDAVGSGRLAAWKGTLTQVVRRPLLGYGFGTESRVFVDRWLFFQGGLPENSYLGLLLQVGAVGLILCLGTFLVAAFAGARVLRAGERESRGIVAVSLAMVSVGLVLMLFQSYVYSVGNIATVSFWLGLLTLIGTAAVAPMRSPRFRLRRAVVLGSAAVLLAGLLAIAVGRWERGRYVRKENAEMQALYTTVGSSFRARSLSAYRPGPPDCLWYAAGETPYAISLCFDRRGRLVEAADRRSGSPVFWSLQPMPAAASIRIDPDRIKVFFAQLDRRVHRAALGH